MHAQHTAKYMMPCLALDGLPLSSTSLKIFSSLSSAINARKHDNDADSKARAPVQVLVEDQNRGDVAAPVAVIRRRPHCEQGQQSQSMIG